MGGVSECQRECVWGRERKREWLETDYLLVSLQVIVSLSASRYYLIGEYREDQRVRLASKFRTNQLYTRREDRVHGAVVNEQELLPNERGGDGWECALHFCRRSSDTPPLNPFLSHVSFFFQLISSWTPCIFPCMEDGVFCPLILQGVLFFFFPLRKSRKDHAMWNFCDPAMFSSPWLRLTRGRTIYNHGLRYQRHYSDKRQLR